MAGCSLRIRFPLMATFKSIGKVGGLWSKALLGAFSLFRSSMIAW
jgi:hypothetical protein